MCFAALAMTVERGTLRPSKASNRAGQALDVLDQSGRQGAGGFRA